MHPADTKPGAGALVIGKQGTNTADSMPCAVWPSARRKTAAAVAAGRMFSMGRISIAAVNEASLHAMPALQCLKSRSG